MIVANEVGANKTFGKDDDEIWLVTESGAEHTNPPLNPNWLMSFSIKPFP